MFGEFVQQASQILSRADAADGAGKDVIEDQCGNRKARHERPHGIADHHINAAAHEHAAAFHIDRAHREAEQHHAQDKPGSTPPDGLLRNAARIECGGREIAQNDGGASPKGNEARALRWWRRPLVLCRRNRGGLHRGLSQRLKEPATTTGSGARSLSGIRARFRPFPHCECGRRRRWWRRRSSRRRFFRSAPHPRSRRSG